VEPRFARVWEKNFFGSTLTAGKRPARSWYRDSGTGLDLENEHVVRSN